MWATLAGVLYKLLGIPQLIALWNARRAGRVEQRAADDHATVQEDITARQIDAHVAGMSDDDLNRELERDSDRKLRWPGPGV